MSIRRLMPAAFAAAALCGLSLSGAAQTDGLLSGALFDRADANRDGVVTRAEIEVARGLMFDKIDANGDRRVTAAEVEAGKARLQERATRRLANLAKRRAEMPTPSERLAALDENRDGKISRDEFVKGETPWFDRLDKNGQGVTKADFEAFLDSNR